MKCPDLVVVLDPNYGDRLNATAIAPVWVVASPVNDAVCESIWADRPSTGQCEIEVVTRFDVDDLDDGAGNLASVLPTLELHHGEVDGNGFVVFQRGFTLGLIGLKLTEAVIELLREVGFTDFEELMDGFWTRKK